MENSNAPQSDNPPPEAPQAEVLKPRADDTQTTENTPAQETVTTDSSKHPRRRYRPSHKATFISIITVVTILVVNAIVLAFVLKRQSKVNDQASNGQVTVSQGTLDKLGVNRSSVGDKGVRLTINPYTQFNNKVSVAGDVNVSGQLMLNDKVSAPDASLTKLQAGDTSLSQLNVNGNGTLSTLNLRNDLIVNGATHLQGPVTIGQLLTVAGNLNVSGNLAIGGTFAVRNIASTGTLTIGGHVVTTGPAPSVSGGSGVGSNGTVSISGNDAAGTVAVNVGVGGGNGILANITFKTKYSDIPHVVIMPIGLSASGFYVNRNTSGFSIGVGNGLSPAGYAFDYIVEQ